jgi:unsaturated chondroitin disaccharide hydrolase
MDITFPNMSLVAEREVEGALKNASEQVRRNLPEFTYHCQNHSSVNGFYPTCENDQWTCGFWPGEIWLSYEYTGDDVFKHAAMILVQSFLNRIKNHIAVNHHDMGFLYSPSCVAAYKLTGSKTAKEAALLAADQLISRFQPVGDFIQAWGEMGVKENYRYIIDCLLNVPLLHWATAVTGDNKYRDIALRHTATCLKNSIRPDNSTYHTFFMNPKTGAPDHGATCQGYKDDSAWARGQAWGVYGTALSYRYERKPEYLEAFNRVTQFYLSRLPEDLVPYWDLTFTAGNEEPRDSSSASIVVCGLLEMAKYVETETSEYYIMLAKQMMKSLLDRYSVKDFSISNGLVLHGTYSKKTPYNTCTPEGVDECVSWGDYFFMEALTRLHKDWNLYW